MKLIETDVNVTLKWFAMPEKNLIIPGLSNEGLLKCTGVQSYYLKKWSEKECVITVKVAVSEKGKQHRNFYKEELEIQYVIGKFFSPKPFVVTTDRRLISSDW